MILQMGPYLSKPCFKWPKYDIISSLIQYWLCATSVIKKNIKPFSGLCFGVNHITKHVNHITQVEVLFPHTGYT